MADDLGPLEEEEMIEILERIARSGADTARIQAIKALCAMRTDDAGEDVPADDWEAIYGDSNVTPIAARKRAG